MKFACSCTFGKEIVVAILDLLSGLASSAISKVGPKGDVTSNKPKVVVPTNEAGIEGNTCRNTPECD